MYTSPRWLAGAPWADTQQAPSTHTQGVFFLSFFCTPPRPTYLLSDVDGVSVDDFVCSQVRQELQGVQQRLQRRQQACRRCGWEAGGR